MEDELKDEDFKRNLLNTFDEIIKKYKQQNTSINKIKGYLGYNNSNEIIMNDKVQKKIKTFFYNNRYS